MTKHRIMWQSHWTGAFGNGDWLPITREQAEQIAENANESDPQFHHWVEAEKTDQTSA